MLGTIVDSYFRGYDCVVLRDCVATTSPHGGLENVLYNSGNVRWIRFKLIKLGYSIAFAWQSYGFVTNSEKVIEAAEKADGIQS